jgi:hypothetical protein
MMQLIPRDGWSVFFQAFARFLTTAALSGGQMLNFAKAGRRPQSLESDD